MLQKLSENNETGIHLKINNQKKQSNMTFTYK